MVHFLQEDLKLKTSVSRLTLNSYPPSLYPWNCVTCVTVTKVTSTKNDSYFYTKSVTNFLNKSPYTKCNSLIVEYVIFLLLALGLFCLHSTMMKCLVRTLRMVEG
jgi:hypothetical protein